MTDEVMQLKKHRSPPYPSMTLEEALDKGRQFYEVAKRNPLSVDVAMAQMGYTSAASSSAKRAIATLISFGILEEDGSKESRRVRMSPLALRLMLGTIDKEREEIIRTMATAPVIYADLVSRFPPPLVPDAEIERYLKVDRDFNPDIVKPLIRDFKATYAFAKLGEEGIIEDNQSDKDGLSGVDNSGETGGRNGHGAGVSFPQGAGVSFPSPSVGAGGKQMSQTEQSQRTFTLPITGERVAFLYAPPGLTDEDFELMFISLDVIKRSTRVQPPPPPFVRTGPAIWHGPDADQPVTVTGYCGFQGGKHYAAIEGSLAGVPVDALDYEVSHS